MRKKYGKVIYEYISYFHVATPQFTKTGLDMFILCKGTSLEGGNEP